MATSNGFLGCSGGREGGGNKEAGKPRAGSVSVGPSGRMDAAAVGNASASGGGQMQIQHLSDAPTLDM